MKHIPLLPFACCLLLCGCGSKSESTAAKTYTNDLTVSNLSGQWVEAIVDGTETLTLNSDMTYDKLIELGGNFPMSSEYHDTWALDGNKLSIGYSDFGTVSDYTVTLQDDGTTMIWDSGNGTIIYRRKS